MATPDGRYEGDLHARLDHLPGAEYPYRVQVFEWHTDSYSKIGLWYDTNAVLDDFPPAKEFRKLDRAVRYLHKVRAAADIWYVRKQEQKRAERERESLL